MKNFTLIINFILLFSMSLSAQVRKTFEIYAKEEALSKFILASRINWAEPADFIMEMTWFGTFTELGKKRFSGYYSVYINLEEKKCIITGNEEFKNIVEKFIRGLENFPEIKVQLFDLTGKGGGRNDWPTLRAQLSKMGIDVNVDK